MSIVLNFKSVAAMMCLLLFSFPIQGQTATQSTPAAASFNVESATQTYLSRLSREQRAKSDAYFEGGYWVQLWQFLNGILIAGLLLGTSASARMRDLTCRVTRFKPIHTAGYGVLYFLVSALLSFPLSLYTDFFREHQYGMATNTLGDWMLDWCKGLILTLLFGSFFLVVLMAVVRRLPRAWPAAGAAVTMAFIILGALIAPVYISPIFNTYKPLADHKILDPILRLARANGIPADRVYEMDASRQTTRISANVSGMLGTTRITLNDNLLQRCSLPEIEAVMAHEMGHYALNHVYKMILFFGAVVVIGFYLLRGSLQTLLDRYRHKWNIPDQTDVAIFPLVVVLFSAYMFVLTPALNTFIRVQESEADIFGLNAARQPDGFSEAALKLADYRKMAPGPVEEFLFYDHPSGRTRIRMAMTWKAENLKPTAP
jgi:STE24 endopeptidase